ncbi:Clp1-domain-containing protein [Nadsonia fulvescens var. elongata DSM 6958]|uniref:Polynucleotide 5'-hydroxyl-kinase GRC3 n=1 Tax=Nadsonia fulvescens var. elongata DSM 6958 TaxID=857566 RepID=A0A1E3PP20_9ASCO|nr:Clp1-domain-containing protein [Nadsonia fulvescens var. elongata DSM 6958]
MSGIPGLPRLNMGDKMSTDQEIIELSPNNEWRFEVGIDEKVVVQLLEGTAEIFGTELAVGVDYTFSLQKSVIFTWHGCRLKYSGTLSSEYVSDETTMVTYANAHFLLEKYRGLSQNGGPNVLIVGPKSSGKTSLSKILCSYATKMSRTPMIVNLDPSVGVYSTPGGLSAAPISDILDIEDGWGDSEITGPALLHQKLPLVYYYGLESPTANLKYYKKVCTRLANGVKQLLELDQKVKSSGIIIDAPYISEQKIYHSLIDDIIVDFRVTHVLVVGNERMYSDLNKAYKNRQSQSQANAGTASSVSIIKLPKSGGCVEPESVLTRALQQKVIREYFYGNSKIPLSPFTVTVDSPSVTVYRIKEDSQTPSQFLPSGFSDHHPESSDKTGKANILNKEDLEQDAHDLLIKIDSASILQNCVLAVVRADSTEKPENILKSELMGFVHVVEADDVKHKLKILMPVPGRLPNAVFLLGAYRYHE